MARDLERSSSQTLTSTTSPVSGGVMTLACWVVPELFANSDIFFCIGNASDHYIRLEFNSAGNVRFKLYDGGGDQADTTTTMTLNTWHHACGVINSTSNRSVFLDGGSKGTDTATNNPTSLDRICFGARYLSTIGQYADCRVAEAGIWDVALSDAEVAILAEGYAPKLIRPQSLVAYWPLLRDEDQDIVGGYDLTANNTPTVTEHPPLIKYSHPIWVVVPPSAAGPATLSINVSDTVTVTESTSAELPSALEASTSDTISLAETTTAQLNSFVIVSDSVTTDESVSAAIVEISALSVSVSDSITVSESVAVSLPNPLALSTSDNVTVSESISVIVTVEGVLNVIVSDSVTITESVAATLPNPLGLTVSDAVTVAESISLTIQTGVFAIAVSDTVTVTDTPVISPLLLILAVSQTIAVTEAASMTLPGYEIAVSGRNATYVTFRDKRMIVPFRDKRSYGDGR